MGSGSHADRTTMSDQQRRPESETVARRKLACPIGYKFFSDVAHGPCRAGIAGCELDGVSHGPFCVVEESFRSGAHAAGVDAEACQSCRRIGCGDDASR